MTESTGKTNRQKSYYVWFDSEYSTLELKSACLLQVAALITDTSLRRLGPADQDIRLAIQLPKNHPLSPWVEENLPDLVGACRSPQAVPLEEADARLAAYVDSFVGPPAEKESLRPILAGNSVHADWWLVYRDLPLFLSRLHYRHLDVTSLKLEWQRRNPEREFNKEDPQLLPRYFPEAYLTEGETRHDAYYDIQASIAELAFYRTHLLKPE
jgi:oligoribonuclease